MMTDIEVQYRELLEEYSDTVTRLCLIHTGNKADAEDCYQNVCFKLFKALKKGDIPNPKAWLLRVTVNECRSLLRYHLRRKTLSLDELITASVDPTDRDLWAVVMDLPPRYRDVIYLFYYEQLSIDGICEATGSNPNTVKSQLKRGREKLKGMLEE